MGSVIFVSRAVSSRLFFARTVGLTKLEGMLLRNTKHVGDPSECV